MQQYGYYAPAQQQQQQQQYGYYAPAQQQQQQQRPKKPEPAVSEAAQLRAQIAQLKAVAATGTGIGTRLLHQSAQGG